VATLIYGVAIFDLSLHVLWLSPVLWLVALLWVVRYPRPAFWQPILVRLIFGMAIMVTTWSALVVLKQQPHFLTWILLLMGLIWGADSGAYFTGRRFGRTKLARRVSPGKSWEGVIGGVVVTQVGVSLFAYSQHWSLEQAFVLAFIALVTVLVSVLGDLTESMFKRHEGVKDSGHLIPGHGGVMDRVDSLTSAAPIFVLLLLLFGLFSWL
jgi:phosphatidate cytidylyltransferase